MPKEFDAAADLKSRMEAWVETDPRLTKQDIMQLCIAELLAEVLDELRTIRSVIPCEQFDVRQS